MNKRLVGLFGGLCMSLMVGVCADDEGIAESSTLSVGAAVDFKADRPDFTSNNKKFAETIDREIALLRREHGQTQIDLEDEAVKALAPQLASFISDSVGLVAQCAKMKKPGVKLQLQDSNLQYNAAAVQAVGVNITIKRTFEVNPRTGEKRLVSTETDEQIDKISDIVVGAELLRLFMWRSGKAGLFAAVLGHEVGHIVFEHADEKVVNEHEADLFAAKLLKKGTDLIVALDMLSLAAHVYNSLKNIVPDKKRVYDLVRAAVNRVVIDVPDLGKLGTATSHAYVATAVKCALDRADQDIIRSGSWDDACFAVYEAVKRACLVPGAAIGVSSQEFQDLCLKAESDAVHLKALKQTHPTPLDRRSLITAISSL